MNKIRLGQAMVLMASVCLSACDDSVADKHQTAADIVFQQGQVYTVNKQQPWAEAVAVKDGKIVYVGSDESVQDYIDSGTQVVDLKGRMLMPGFQDAHVHPLEGASLETFMGCDLTQIGEDRNPEHWIETLRACNEIDFPHDWILGGGHNLVDLLSLKRTPREVLDDAFPDKPAAFMEKTSHSMWVNSKALELVGIDKDTPNPTGGLIFKDKNGDPNGILSDSAGDELMHLALAKTPQLQEARYEALLASQDYMVKHGITSATNARVYWDRGNHEPWLRAEREGTLKTRSIMALWTYPHMDDRKQLDSLKAMYRDEPGSLLRWSMIKFYADGVVGNNSAAVIEPYHYRIHPDSKPHGLNYFDEARMTRYIEELEKVGFDIHIHALGDRGIRESLNAIESVQKTNANLGRDRRHQLTHVTVIRREDIPRFAALDVTANFQINFGPEFMQDPAAGSIDYHHVNVDDEDFWYKLLGPVDVTFVPVLEVFDSGGRVVLSSDWDVETINPLVSIATLATQVDEKHSREDLIAIAIESYTLNAAYVMRHDDLTGSIEVGKYADLVVLDNNLFTLTDEAIGKANIEQTWLAGKKVYQR